MQADYVIVGAGSAGCVLADRLSEDGARVALLEAGPPDRHPMIHVPAGILHLLRSGRVNWNYRAEPDGGTAGREIYWPRGKVLGGSSSINGMLYVRGNAADYDTWAQMGCRGWTYEEVLPLFKRSEAYASGEDDYRGRRGPLKVTDYQSILTLTHRFVEAAQQAGFIYRADLNGRDQEGVGYSQMTRAGRLRASTARTFLAQARRRSNLSIHPQSTATGLMMDGRRCTGVRFRQGGTDREIHARREVIVSGGTVNSPQLLQVSGIGPGEHLREIGVPVVYDLPGVGANLQDHYVIRLAHRVAGAISINELSRGLRLAREVAKWAVSGRGALTFGVTSAMVFCRSHERLASPDLQLMFTPGSYDVPGFGTLEREPGVTVAVCPTRPDSRGSIMAQTPNPLEPPLIRPGYLSAESDHRVLLAGVRETRRIFAAPALAQHSRGETVPGAEVDTDDALLAFAREQGITVYHPVGTCKMGTDPMAVVDPRLRVHGVDALRVIDASVMPTVTTGNTNAPTIMIGEKGADMIREDRRAVG